MPLMRVTPMYKSKWGYLAILAYAILILIVASTIGKVIHMSIISLVCACILCWWLWPLAVKAQLEQDWELAQTPRVNIHE